MHQLSHLWIDFRGLQDEFMREHEIDYFENSRRAAHVQQQYAIHNPREFRGYGENVWGSPRRTALVRQHSTSMVLSDAFLTMKPEEFPTDQTTARLRRGR